MKTYKGLITELKDNEIFVFGSNTEGRHGAGAARLALMRFGAHYGNAMGLQGQSYAIITKNLTKEKHPSVSKGFIIEQISEFYTYANENEDKLFYIAYHGKKKNLNGYTPKEMAEMFSAFRIPDNVVFEENFSHLLRPIK